MVHIAIIASLDAPIFSEITHFFEAFDVRVTVYQPSYLDPLAAPLQEQFIFNLIPGYPIGITLKSVNSTKQILLQILPQLFAQALQEDNLKLLFKVWARSRVYISDQIMQNGLLLSYKHHMYDKTYPIGNTAIFKWVAHQLDKNNYLSLLEILTINQPYGELSSMVEGKSSNPNGLSAKSIFKLIHVAILSLAEQNANHLWGLLSLSEQLEFTSTISKNYFFLEEEPYPITSNPSDWIAAIPRQIDLRIKMIGDSLVSSKDIEFMIQESLNWKDDLNMIYRKSPDIEMLEMQLDCLIHTAFECALPVEENQNKFDFSFWPSLSLDKKCDFIEQDFADLEWVLFQEFIHKWIRQELEKIATDILLQNDIGVGFLKSNEFLILLDNPKFNLPEILKLKSELPVFIEDMHQMLTPANPYEITETVIAVKPLKESRSDLMKAIKLGDTPLITNLLNATNVVSSKILLALIDLNRPELIQNAYLKKSKLFTSDLIAMINTQHSTCIEVIPNHPSFKACITKAKLSLVENVLNAIKKNPRYLSNNKSLTLIETVVLKRINSSKAKVHERTLDNIPFSPPIYESKNSEIAEPFLAEVKAEDRFISALQGHSLDSCNQIWNELTMGEQISLVCNHSSQPFFENFLYNWIVRSARLSFKNGTESEILTNTRFLFLLGNLSKGCSLQMDDLKEALSNVLIQPRSKLHLHDFPKPQQNLVFDRCPRLNFFSNFENTINGKNRVVPTSDCKSKEHRL